MFYTWQVADKEYQLKLTMKSMSELEDKLGRNPLMLFGTDGTLPSTKDLVIVLHSSMEKFNHGISVVEVYDILDNWIDDGHTYTEIPNLIMDLYKASGLIADKDTEEDKSPNAKKGKK